MSVAGHLALLAMLVTSFFFVGGNIETIITQNRVQITEIDLSQVKITRDETKLYNTGAPEPEKKKPEPEKQKKQDTEIGDEKSDTPTVLPDTKKPTDAKPDETLPKNTMVVRVNRESRNLDRTMTISVVDALRVAMTRCWVIDTTHPGIEDIRAVAHLTLYKNGMVRDMWFESAARADSDPAFAYVLETIRSAVKTCQPFKMLPASEFDAWEKIQLTFYPTTGTIM